MSPALQTAQGLALWAAARASWCCGVMLVSGRETGGSFVCLFDTPHRQTLMPLMQKSPWDYLEAISLSTSLTVPSSTNFPLFAFGGGLANKHIILDPATTTSWVCVIAVWGQGICLITGVLVADAT